MRYLQNLIVIFILLFLSNNILLHAEEIVSEKQKSIKENSESVDNTGKSLSSRYTLFDDKILLSGYADKYKDTSKEILLEMIKDDTLSSYKSAAAVRVFKEKFSTEVFAREKKIDEKILLRRLSRTTSPFVEVEIMHTLCKMDRYRYFNSMVPALLQKLNHYNTTVNEMASNAITDIIDTGNNRTREAIIVFNTLRKMLFLSRNRLEGVKEPNPKLARKLKILRWSIKVLGKQELKKLPKEVINIL